MTVSLVIDPVRGRELPRPRSATAFRTLLTDEMPLRNACSSFPWSGSTDTIAGAVGLARHRSRSAISSVMVA